MNEQTGTPDARPYMLAETNWKAVQEASFEIAVLPWGATEAHNYHMPYGTDNYQADFVASEAARLAWEQGARVIVLPCVPFGINTGQLDIDLCINMRPATQLAVLRDIADVVCRAGIRKLVLFNGHGGNNFKNMIRELSMDFPDLFTCWINWYQAVDWNQYFDDPGDHAGEMETSAMLHIAPGLLRPLQEAGSGKARKPAIQAMRDGWVSTQRPWTRVTEDTGVGDPAAATAEKGVVYLKACAKNIAAFFTDLAETPIEELYI